MQSIVINAHHYRYFGTRVHVLKRSKPVVVVQHLPARAGGVAPAKVRSPTFKNSILLHRSPTRLRALSRSLISTKCGRSTSFTATHASVICRVSFVYSEHFFEDLYYRHDVRMRPATDVFPCIQGGVLQHEYRKISCSSEHVRADKWCALMP